MGLVGIGNKNPTQYLVAVFAYVLSGVPNGERVRFRLLVAVLVEFGVVHASSPLFKYNPKLS